MFGKVKKPPHLIESHEEYGKVLLQLDDRTRIIRCRDDIQNIVQRKGGDTWHGKSFCTTLEALVRDAGYIHQDFEQTVLDHVNKQ